MDKSQDVMVLIYSTKGCRVCEDLWPLYIEAAKLLHKTSGLVFTSINMAANELPEVHNIFYYPTLRYYPMKSKYRPYDFDGNLALSDILKFISRVAQVQIVESRPEDETAIKDASQ
jgi:hypothetical protein